MMETLQVGNTEVTTAARTSGTSEAQVRPRPVSTAVTLLYINFALGILGNMVSLASGAVPGWSIVSIVIGAIVQLWFINKIGQGKNWARILYLVLFILGVPITIGGLFLMRGAMVAVSVVGMLIGFALSIIILTRLFGAQSSPWFKRKPTP
jgi:hypothetical protein